jgi:Ca2+-dependent lipid-binding protein
MQKVEIYLSARNLLDKDFFSKSDPYIKLYFKRDPSHKETYVGRTETINNNLNPNFNTAFKLDYVFEIHQELRFEIFDYDNGIEDDFLGEVKCSLGAVAGAKSQTLICDIKNSKANNSKGTVNNGKLIIRM